MIRKNIWLALALLTAMVSTRFSAAQSDPTAVQPLQLSAFAAVSGVYTGLPPAGALPNAPGGRNLSITAGVDLGLISHHGIRPVIEVRGTLPVDKGNVDAEESVLFGGRFEFWLGHRLHPYADFLFGRGQTNYPGGYIYYPGGNVNNGYQYRVTTTNVFSPGGGVDFDLTPRIAIRADIQYQRWGGPQPTASGSIWSKPITLGAVYHFDFNHHPRR
jgi:hypothetical protein